MAQLAVYVIKYTLFGLGLIVFGLISYWIYFLSKSKKRKQQNIESRKLGSNWVSDNKNASKLPQSIAFIRHGQAKHNVSWKALNEKDPELTKHGIKQTQDLKAMILNEFPNYFEDVELIIVSPLNRTIQTLNILIDNKWKQYKDKIILQPLSAERGNKLCDIGNNKRDLLLQFPDLELIQSWSDLKQEWWIYPEQVDSFEKRIINFKSWIQLRPERNILVVSHCGVIQSLTTKNLQNAELFVTTWDR